MEVTEHEPASTIPIRPSRNSDSDPFGGYSPFDWSGIGSFGRDEIEPLKLLIHGAGERYRRCRLDNFEIYDPKQRAVLRAVGEYAAKLPGHVAAGDGVILYGPAGTGKDHLLVALGKEAIAKHGMRVEYVNAQELFQRVRDAFGSKSSDTERSLLEPFIRAQILIIADPVPAAGVPTDFQSNVVYRLIDARYRNCKPTWTSMNVTGGADAESVLGVPTIDRLRHGALTLHCNWPSYRQRSSGIKPVKS